VKTFDVYLQPGLNDFGLYLDSENQVAESDETNNFRVAKINLTGSCLDKVVAPAAPARKPGIEHEDIGIRRR
jgi:subtilase family serine protease